MKTKVFLDSNVLLDLFVESRASESADWIFAAVKAHILEAQVSTQSLVDIEFISHRMGVKFVDFEAFARKVFDVVNVSQLDQFHLEWALDHPTGDFEDDAQIRNAYDGACDFFITRDEKLFGRKDCSPMVIISPTEFVTAMQSEEE